MQKLLFAAVVVTASLVSAQTKPAVSNMQVNRNANLARTIQADPVQTLQRQVAQLQAQVKELRRQLDMVMADAKAAHNNIPKCSADYRQSASPNGTRDCEPYMCDAVSGACLMSCATTNDCTPGTACNMENGRCERY